MCTVSAVIPRRAAVVVPSLLVSAVMPDLVPEHPARWPAGATAAVATDRGADNVKR